MKRIKMFSGIGGIIPAYIFSQSVLFGAGLTIPTIYGVESTREKLRIENTYAESSPANRVLLLGYRLGLESSIFLNEKTF